MLDHILLLTTSHSGIEYTEMYAGSVTNGNAFFVGLEMNQQHVGVGDGVGDGWCRSLRQLTQMRVLIQGRRHSENENQNETIETTGTQIQKLISMRHWLPSTIAPTPISMIGALSKCYALS